MRFKPSKRGSFFGEYDKRTRSFFFGPAPTMSKPRMNDSSRRTCATATFRRDDGISTMGCRARTALRMRVSMSAIGSVSNARLPARFRDTRNLALEGQLPETDTTECKLPDKCPRPTASLAAVVLLDFEPRGPQRFRDCRFLRQKCLRLTPLLAGTAYRATRGV